MYIEPYNVIQEEIFNNNHNMYMHEGKEYVSKISSYNELNVYMKCGDSRQEERGHISFILLSKQHGISKIWDKTIM